MTTQHSGLRTWIEVDTKSIKHNYSVFRSIIQPQTKLCAVVKSNAYGHGLVDFAHHITTYGADYIAVDSVVEGITLRKAGITTPILILGYTLPERIVDIHTYNLEMTVSHIQCFSEVLSYAEKNKTPVSIHLKIDTDMHRQGFNITEKEHMVDILSTHTNKIHLKGVYSHFANAKDPAHTEKTQSQLNVFLEWKRSVTETGMSPLFHISATGATFLHPEAHFDMVRIGMGLYGYYPSKDIETNYKACNLQPILKWKSIVSEIKKVEAGETIGYGTSYTTKSPTIIGIVPVGYWHGYDKGFSNVGLVRIENTNVPVIGLISMDMILINISQVPDISIGDEVILLDNTVPEMQATTLAESIHTSPYEILTRINPLIHKIYL